MLRADSNRHVKAIAVQLIEKMKQSHFRVIHLSGVDNGDWALVDLGDIIVHIMQAETRTFYNLEGLWQN